MASTTVPPIVFTPTGLQLPQETSVLDGVLADMNTAFGGGMSTSLTSPQGQLAQSFAAIIGDKNNQIADIISEVTPDTAEGRWQDAIGQIYFLTRIAASGTVVNATIGGLVGTVVPAGSLAQDTAGYIYQSLANATIGSAGTVGVQFQGLTTGPIGVAIGALNKIYKAVNGWETVTNAAAGIPGTNVESRADFEYRRKASVAVNAVNSIQSVLAAVLAVPNVLDAYVTDNSTNATVNTGSTNYPIIANSIYVAVTGGAAADIAQAIWSKKSLGCAYNGSTTYTLTDQSGGVMPYPTYAVKWVTPASLPVYVKVQLVNNALLPSNITALVQAAVLAAFAGSDGGARARIGSTLYAGRYYAGISAIAPSVEILLVNIGTSASPTTTSINVGIDKEPTLAQANITVTLV